MIEVATFGAGCFWGVESAFRQLAGVVATTVGFMGGHVDNPSYQQVCTHETGHVEVVQVEYDSEKISYEDLLNAFWECHDPTQVNRQGWDVGDQYRSVIFFHTPRQRELATAAKADLNGSGKFKRPIATSIEAAQEFYKAEEYHQQYYEKKGIAPACNIK